MNMETFGAWYNLIFLIPFGLGLLMLVIQTLGLGDADFGHDIDHDADHDADQDAENEVSQPATFWRAASVLGIGQVPVMIVLLTFCFIWGFVGFMLNTVLQPLLRTPFLFLPLSMGGTMVLAVFLTGQIAKIVAKIFPKTTTFAYTEEDFVGKEAEALYSIDQVGGTIRVRDDNGNLQQYSAYVETEKPITSGSKVLLVSYNHEKGAYLVSVIS